MAASGRLPVDTGTSILLGRTNVDEATGRASNKRKRLHLLQRENTASGETTTTTSKRESNKACPTSGEQSTLLCQLSISHRVRRSINNNNNNNITFGSSVRSESCQLHVRRPIAKWFIVSLVILNLSSWRAFTPVAGSTDGDHSSYLPLTRDARALQGQLSDSSVDGQSHNETHHQPRQTKCYEENQAQQCVPGFVNAAYLRQVDVTNVCGVDGPSKYCSQTEVGQTPSRCDICDASDTEKAHPAYYLTDVNDNNNTWWQSQTMFEGVQNPKAENPIPQINLTIHLGKAFDITYIQLKFYSPRPASFAIYKKRTDDSPWTPFQFYSYDCALSYSTPDKAILTRENETRASCTSEFSDISPLTGGHVVFTTLEGRPSSRDFENSPELQEFVAATAIRITLDKMNTFGEEVFNDETVLRSYFYAIYDLSIGGICKCNGHASECIPVPGQAANDDLNANVTSRLICNCQHNTAGPDCETCLPFYNDQPWGRGTALDASECKPCNCNGRSNRCYFDQELWQRTGHGGHCLDCADNTDGPNCERCKENFYQSVNNKCIACNCDPIGSISLQCNSQGQCMCKPGVEGQRCDRCAANHYDFSIHGCKSCGCNEAGSLNNTATCDPITGQCRCKANVEGLHCSSCKPGHFDLSYENEFGCLPCFCYGHSSICQSASGYYKYIIESVFNRDNERWTTTTRSGHDVPVLYNAITKNIGVQVQTEDAYFTAPDRFLGDQKASYNQHLSFTLRIGERGAKASAADVVLEGAGMKISQPIFGQGNPLPSTIAQVYRFKLHEDANSYGWQPKLRAKDFISVLSNLTAIKIRATYTNGNRGTGYLDDVRLDSANVHQFNFGQRATWIESCTCPPGYIGSFCESCAPGYRHNPPGGGSFAECVPCNCNGHADLCDNDSGACICNHNTTGLNCERCAEGFYGNALSGNLTACQPCPCPDGGPCAILPNEQIACLQCPSGYGGLQCDACIDGYYGDPKGGRGVNKLCRDCDCNGNIDPNAIGNCNTTTGECVKCIYNTHGPRCERCLPGFYGDALALPKGNCRPCRCNHLGTYPSIEKAGSTYDTAFTCESNGQCRCKPYVDGRMCDRCMDGYFNLNSGNGCEPCNCNLIGSVNRTCDPISGQCYCRPGVTGKNCDQCLPLHFGFSIEGCRHCDCDRVGSTSPQCDGDGQCNCKPNVEGRRCERCRENKHDKEAGCVDCHVCYNLIQDAVDEHRRKLSELELMLDQIEKDPQIVNDALFDRQLSDVTIRVKNLLDQAVNAQGSDKSLVVQLESLRNRTAKVRQMSIEIDSRLQPIAEIVNQGVRNITLAEEIIDRASELLSSAQKVLDHEGQNALSKASERSKKFGQQSERMTEIAKQARLLANKYEDESIAIEKLAKEAFSTAEDAYKLALDAIQAQKTNREELQRLDRQLEETTELMSRTSKMAEEAKNEASKAYTDTLAIYTDINSIIVPSLESEKLRIEAIDLVGQAERILDEALQLLRKNADALNNTQYQQQDARDLLVEATRQQQIADDLLTEVMSSLAKANESIWSGENTLGDAQKTLDTLKEFDRVVQESRSKAEDALSKVGDIKRLIDEAESKTREAENALQGALQDASEARDVAIEAQKLAEKTSEDATRIRQEAATTKARASNLKKDAEQLTDKVADTASRLKQFEDQAATDKKLAADALERANQAKSASSDANAKVKQAIDTVNSILNALDDVHDIDANHLAELERKLIESENELKAANLDVRLSTLQTARDSQKNWLRNFESEIEQLKKDVANINQIRHAIPEKCFRRVRLEP